MTKEEAERFVDSLNVPRERKPITLFLTREGLRDFDKAIMARAKELNITIEDAKNV